MVYFQALLLRVTAQKLKAGAVPKPSGYETTSVSPLIFFTSAKQ